MNQSFLTIGFGITAFFALTSTASAASGTIQGHFKFEQHNGGYCDPGVGQNCTLARYVAAQYQTVQPLQNARIWLENQSGGVVGICSTNTAGYYSCNWSSGLLPSWVRVVFRFQDKEQRFQVFGSNGTSHYRYRSSKLTVQDNQTLLIGTITIPQMGIAQLYDAAQRMYYAGPLSGSAKMVADFTGVRIRAYNDQCAPSACASGKDVFIPNSTKAYEGFVTLHELGHVVDNVANSRRKFTNYCYPNQSIPCSGEHGLTSSEWRGAALNEGFASYVATMANYGVGAPEPRQCFFTSGRCLTGNEYLIESQPGLSCSGTIGRQETQHTRYLWDITDIVNDGENITSPFYRVINAIRDTPPGYGWGRAESPYANSGSTIDAWDSFNSWEYNETFENTQGINTSPLYFANCLGYF